MTTIVTLTAGLPHLDVYSLSTTWALGEALHGLWAEIATSLGTRPSHWIDDDGRQIYAAVLGFDIATNLAKPVGLDDEISLTTNLIGIRKPHAIGETTITANGQHVMTLRLLTSLVRRDTPGSNKKLSKVRTLWQVEDRDAAEVDGWLARHHSAKSATLDGPVTLTHEANRLADFNAADLFYFRNFAHLACAAEWREARGRPTRLAQRRQGFYYGNVDDGDAICARVDIVGDEVRCELSRADGGLLFVSIAETADVTLALR